MKLDINLRYLRALLPLAAEKDVRFYLNGVCVEFHPDKTVYLATNGNVAGMLIDKVTNEVDSVKTLILPRDTVKQIKVGAIEMGVLEHRAQAAHKRDYLLENPGSGQVLGFDAIDGIFPDVRRVIPMECSGEAGNYDACLLYKFAEVNKLLGRAVTMGIVNVKQNGKEGPALVKLHDENFTGVIMPYRV